jgi:hypothetical protein
VPHAIAHAGVKASGSRALPGAAGGRSRRAERTCRSATAASQMAVTATWRTFSSGSVSRSTSASSTCGRGARAHVAPRSARVAGAAANAAADMQRLCCGLLFTSKQSCTTMISHVKNRSWQALMGRRGRARARAREAEHEQLCSRAAESLSTVCRTSACARSARAGSHCATMTQTAPALPVAHLHLLSLCDQAHADPNARQ